MWDSRRTVTRRQLAPRLLLGGALFAGLSCSGGDILTPTTGTVEISAATSGPEPDPDGYALTIDEGSETAIGPNATLWRNDLEPGTHSIRLLGVATNCTVADENPRVVTVAAGDTALVAFSITCTATTGSLEITTATTGGSPDADGYTVTVDGGAAQSIGIDATLTVANLAPGTHDVALAGLASNCEVGSNNPRSVTVAAGATAATEFTISCPTPVVANWTPMTSGTGGYLEAVWGTSSTDVFAVGGGVILHFDGRGWSEQLHLAGAGPLSIWGASSSNLFTVGGGASAILHYDGHGWSDFPAPSVPNNAALDLRSVWGTSSTDMFVTGGVGLSAIDSRGLIAHYDGSSWSVTLFPGPLDYDYNINVMAIWGTSENDLWAVLSGYSAVKDDTRGVVLHYDGRQWTTVFMQDNMGPVATIWGSGPNDVYIGGWNGNSFLHYDGNSLSPVPTPLLGVDAIWGSSATDVFAVAFNGIQHYGGPKTGWTVQRQSDGFESLRGVWGSSPTDVYAVGERGTILHGTP